MEQKTISRIEALRKFMKDKGLNAFIFPSTDPHFGEYTPKHWESRKWISGFTGSAGTVVITLNDSALWTDSRYFIQAEEQLSGTGIRLMKERTEGTPSIAKWLTDTLPFGAIVGLDGKVNSIDAVSQLNEELSRYGIHLRTEFDPADNLWENRPPIPANPIIMQPLQYAGMDSNEKLDIIRKEFTKNQSEGILISALDEIAWTLNLRGSDTHCNPVFVSFLLITKSDATLFIDRQKISGEIADYLKSIHIQMRDYGDLEAVLKTYAHNSIQLDADVTGYTILSFLPQTCQINFATSPIPLLKAVKNEAEIAGFHSAMLKDGVAMVRFLMWLERNIGKSRITEIDIAGKLVELRSQQKGFRDISFDTIAGYGAHAAIVHYEATLETDIPLQPKGLILIDSGAQYQEGTTDITRTVSLGETTDDEKKDYTLVLKGHLQLAHAVFPKGTCGTQLDILARNAMWKCGINYGHGTGHGVGSYLCVHEGPHQIRMNNMPTPLMPGMTVTNEPGIYKAERHGVRTENMMLVTTADCTEFGDFYQFEALTLCPIDTKPIVKEMLTKEEIIWLNNYHADVYRKLTPLLASEERIWLKNATKPI